ncbi:hypothetical protein [Massilia sp. YIM B04103]|uniref:hypothetical protein n=1 Tax=Massilia sp. YIM B04103 TaxID=2963106 RepID=UPI00210DE2FC|nr:hypothetical protein [Massilia sp. YIM B04103]
MRKLYRYIAIAASFSSLAYAEIKKPWDGSYQSFKGDYLIYSGDLGEQQPPTRADRKASFVVEGRLAKELFESIAPDLKDACGTLSGLRVRQKGHVDCTYDKDHPASPYTCHFGLDLRSGKSTTGSIC